MIPNHKTLLGRLLRLPLRLVPRAAVVSVLSGELRGAKWIVGAANHGCWMGTYERRQCTLFRHLMSEGSVLYDVGAHAGYYALIGSRLVGESGKVFAFEPLPRNLWYLREHIRLNAAHNITVIDSAVCGKSCKMRFRTGSSVGGHIDTSGDLVVNGVDLDGLSAQGIPQPDFIKMDIEGAELEALSAAREVLMHKQPIVFLSTHGSNIHEHCLAYLKDLGYYTKVIERKRHDQYEVLCSTSADVIRLSSQVLGNG